MCLPCVEAAQILGRCADAGPRLPPPPPPPPPLLLLLLLLCCCCCCCCCCRRRRRRCRRRRRRPAAADDEQGWGAAYGRHVRERRSADAPPSSRLPSPCCRCRPCSVPPHAQPMGEPDQPAGAGADQGRCTCVCGSRGAATCPRACMRRTAHAGSAPVGASCSAVCSAACLPGRCDVMPTCLDNLVPSPCLTLRRRKSQARKRN